MSQSITDDVQEYATIPPRVLFNRSIAAAAWFSLCLGGAFFVCVTGSALESAG